MVKLTEIEHELEEIWDAVESPNKTKAALFNLVIYSQDRAHEAYVREGSQRILDKYPCRVIFLLENQESEEDYLHAEVSVASVGSPDFPVACDQIWLEFAGKERARIPYILLPHIVPDLPLYLWWAGNPASESDLFTLLEKHINRILFDPDTLDALPTYANFALSLLERFSGVASDLHWTLTRGWRALIAHVFDSEEHLGQLRLADQLTIGYCQGADPVGRDGRLSAVYLQAWLATQMGWSFKYFEQGSRFIYEAEGRKVTVVLSACREERPHGSIVHFEAHSVEGYHYRFGPSSDPLFARVDRSNTTRCDLPFNFYIGHANRDRALVRELFSEGTSTHYQQMLKLIASIDWRNCQ